MQRVDRGAITLYTAPMFKRDAATIKAYARQNAENTFRVLAFAVATANCPFMQSVETLRYLRRIGENVATLEYADIPTGERSAAGMGLNPMKVAAYRTLWADRESIYSKYIECLTLDNGHLTFWNYILDNLPGMGMVKAAFAVQMLFNELGCIDVHNAREQGVKMPTGRAVKNRPVYLNIQAVKTSEQWWDDWCVLLAAKYPGQFRDGDHVSFLHSVAIFG